MQLSGELILSLIASALTGAAMAWLGNRVLNAELWGHVRNHCAEIARMQREHDEFERSIKDDVRSIHTRISETFTRSENHLSIAINGEREHRKDIVNRLGYLERQESWRRGRERVAARDDEERE